MNTPAKIGIIGLGVMGENLALNMERNGFPTAVWERIAGKTQSFVQDQARGKQVFGAETLQQLAALLEKPRRILMMVKAGDPVDWTINQVKPYLERDDILMDGGNSHFQDTIRREKELAAEGIRFMGIGISGGEVGALEGPSIMPGGDRKAFEAIRPILEAIAAKVEDGPCVTYIGPNGAGHFVKMVHNGIEYGDMQLIAEAYDLLRRILHLEAEELSEIFEQWNQGVLNSYLIEITAKIFKVKDSKTGKPLVDLIVDKAGQKGTGKWASILALEVGIPVPTIHAAVEARVLSSLKDERLITAREFPESRHPKFENDPQDLIQSIHDALYASKICSYAQGMALIRGGSDQYQWNINLSEVSRIWKGGCIIRAQFVGKMQAAFQRKPDLRNLLLDPEFRPWILEAQPRWRQTVAVASTAGVPVMATSSSLAYFDSYRSEKLPQNLTQAQRDFFGAHLYERIDQPEAGSIHTNWEEEVSRGTRPLS